MDEYREIAPPPRLAEAIECLWTAEQSGPSEPHRVLPDGCADILFTHRGGTAALDAIGPMTAYRDFPVPGGPLLLVGVRFRPGMWTACLGVPGEHLRDGIVPLDDLWGARARELRDRLAEQRSAERCAAVFTAALGAPVAANPVQRALAWMERRGGRVDIDDLARQAGLGARQFRRVCLEQAGLTPKFLARVLRFRHALARLAERPRSFAEFALDCGYYDQAHCIHEFRALAGRTPTDFAHDRFFQSPRPDAA